MAAITGFKAYDYRGRIPGELNADVAYRIGRAYAEFLKPKRVVVGRDIRLSSDELCDALTRGCIDSGVDVYDIGLCGTEVVYFATFSEGMDGGIMVTASHNPPDYNGMKFVREQSRPISGDTGLKDIQRIAEADAYSRAGAQRARATSSTCAASTSSTCCRTWTAPKLQEAEDRRQRRQRRRRPGRRSARAAPAVRVHQDQSRAGRHVSRTACRIRCWRRIALATIEAIRKHGADLRRRLGRRLRSLLPVRRERRASSRATTSSGCSPRCSCKRERGARIVHDPRLTWATLDMVESLGGKAVMSKSGHAFMKDVMREADAVYGGEMSAHHYFRRFGYCDSGQIPWLLVAQLMCESGKPLSALVGERIAQLPGERRDQPQGRRREGDDPARPGALPAQRALGRLHRRPLDGVRPLALQPALLEHRAADPPQRRKPRRRGADARAHRRAAADDRRRGRALIFWSKAAKALSTSAARRDLPLAFAG